MPETPSFVVNDRRKFTSEGELRHDTPAESTTSSEPVPQPTIASTQLPEPATEAPVAGSVSLAEMADAPEASALGALNPDESAYENDEEDPDNLADFPADALPPGPTTEQAAEAARAYTATAERLDIAMRASNPGGERIPEMTFERLVQSLYTQALILLGGGAQPGETPRVDILGARETIDMLAVLAAKSKGNLNSSEEKLLQSALFDLQMGFLEITQALARQAAQRQTAGAGLGGPGGGAAGPGGPRIVR